MKFFDKFGIYVILIIGLILRLVNIDQSLWLDEAISGLAAKNYSFSGIIFEFLKGDNHPPLFYLLLKLWGIIFGFSDLALRMLPIICGTLTILATYFLLKKIIQNRLIVLTGTLLLALSPLHIYYSQEVRMYPVLALLAVLIMYVFSFLLSEKTKIRHWVFFSILLVLLIGTDYVGLFLLPVFFILGGWGKFGKKWWLKFGVSWIPLVISGLVWLPVLLAQMETASQQLANLPGWKALAGGATLKEVAILWMKFVLGRITINPHVFYYFLVAVFSIPVLFSLFLAFKKFRQTFFLWNFLIIPLIASFLVSVFIPAFNYFRMIYTLPVFYGLIAYGIFQVKRRDWQLLVLGLIVVGNLIGCGFYFFDVNNQREDWKQAVNYVQSQKVQLAVFEFPSPFDPYKWYSNGQVDGFGALNALTSDKYLTQQKMENHINSEIKKVAFISYLRDLTDPGRNVEYQFSQMNFKEIGAKSFAGVGEVVIYERN